MSLGVGGGGEVEKNMEMTWTHNEYGLNLFYYHCLDRESWGNMDERKTEIDLTKDDRGRTADSWVVVEHGWKNRPGHRSNL